MIQKNNWYRFLKEYNGCYLACENSINYYYDKQGVLLTQSYRYPSPNSSECMSSLCYTKDNVLHTYYIEFTTEGIVYGIGKYRVVEGNDDNLQVLDFDYFFTPYDGE